MKAKTFMLPVLYNAISILLSSTVTAAARFQTFMLTAESAHSYQKANGAVFPSSPAVKEYFNMVRQASKPETKSIVLNPLFDIKVCFWP